VKPTSTQSLDRLLESAVVQSWPDLMKGATSGSLHLEYGFAPDNSLDYLTLWSSTVQGQWDLVCDYWMSSAMSHNRGIHFKDGFRSEGLSYALGFIMLHQRTFSPLPNFGRTGLLRIKVPTAEETRATAKSLSDAFCRVNSFSAEPSSGQPQMRFVWSPKKPLPEPLHRELTFCLPKTSKPPEQEKRRQGKAKWRRAVEFTE